MFISKHQKSEVAAGPKQAPSWWIMATPAEREVIKCTVLLLRSLKRSPYPEVSAAGAKWERGICCFLRVRLKHEAKRKLKRIPVWALVKGGMR